MLTLIPLVEPEPEYQVDPPDRRAPMCGCLHGMRGALRPHNVEPAVDRSTGRAVVFCRRLDPQKSVPVVLALFCPFCGTEYE